MKIERRSFFATLFAPLLARFAPKAKAFDMTRDLKVGERITIPVMYREYEEALTYSLALELAPIYDTPNTPQLRTDYQRALNHLQSCHAERLAAMRMDSVKRILGVEPCR